MTTKFSSTEAFQVGTKVKLVEGMSVVEPSKNGNSSEVAKPAVSADLLSLIHISIMYLRSMNVSKAESALKKTSNAGSIQATFALTLLYYYGLVEGGLSAVLRYSSKAAFAYHVPSMNILGSLLKQGIALEQHPHEAESWVQMAKILDPTGKYSHHLLDPCQVDDESLIEDIIGVLEGTTQEFYDLKKATTSIGKLNISLPKSGKFVKLNKPETWEAFRDFTPESGFQMTRQAAEDGFVTAMYHVSSMYRRGYGAEPNPDQADAWFYAARKLDVDNKGLFKFNFALNK